MSSLGAFLSTSLTPNSYHNEHISPLKHLHLEKDHILASVCKRLNNDPSSHAP
jgi:hypothetical protein